MALPSYMATMRVESPVTRGLLKKIAGTLHHEDILSDVFRDTAKDKPSATLSLRIGDQVENITWPELARQELRRIHFYDGQCRDIYVNDELDFPYRPSPLAIMDGLIKACGVIRERIDIKLQENAKQKKPLPSLDVKVANSDAGKFLSQLSSNSPIKFFDEVDSRYDETVETIKELRAREISLRNSDTGTERQRLINQAGKLETLHQHVQKLDSIFGGEDVVANYGIRSQLESLQQKADDLAVSFDEEPLVGVGSTSWKKLWESAKRFSEQKAYRGQAFPVVGDESRCVLCQQKIRPKGRDRFKKFDSLAENNIQIQLKETTEAYETILKAINEVKISSNSIVELERDLELDQPRLIEEFREFLCNYEDVREQILDTLRGNRQEEPKHLDIDPISDKLKKASAETRTFAKNLDDPILVQKKIGEIISHREELELLIQISESREAILHEIMRLKKKEELEATKSTTGTAPITNKVKQFSEEAITDVIRDRFTRETQKLHLERVTLTHTRASKGKLLHQPKLVDPRQSVELPKVFSEGERTSLGLAAFFTEIALDDSKSTLILDDPVTSLDHRRRTFVATRLAELAVDRQVVIFTHDVAFVGDIKREALERTVQVTERSVSRSRADEGKTG